MLDTGYSFLGYELLSKYKTCVYYLKPRPVTSIENPVSSIKNFLNQGYNIL